MKRRLISAIAIIGTIVAATHAQQEYVYTPTNVVGIGLTYIVPDMLVWSHAGGYTTNGPIENPGDQLPNLGNWEPYISVLGNTTFLIGKNTFADDDANQNFVVVFQPVNGGTPKIAYEFYDDSGAPFTGQINLSRQNGNPQRVAGDPRTGATTYITMAETSVGQLAPFRSAARTSDPFRWDRNPIYGGGDPLARYAAAQIFSLNTTTLVPTPLTKAFDPVYGAFVTDDPPVSPQQVSRTGGSVVGLDNGNFAVVIHDKTGYMQAGGDVTTAAIVSPSGAIIKGPFLVDPRDIWDNVCAYSGGFAVRVHNMLYFYDNEGNLKSSVDITESSGLPFGTGRGDNSRIASNIGSKYVYLVGETPEGANSNHNPCSLAVFDTTTAQCILTTEVSDTDPAIHKMGRVTAAADENNCVCVAYELNPDPLVWTETQVVARIGRLTGTNFVWLTPSFFVFVNHEDDPYNVMGYTTRTPSVAMTAKAICIAAKGTVNGTNTPEAGPTTAPETTVYAVITPPFVPGSIESVGLTRIVPDTVITNPALPALGNWEPYAGVLGNSTFLISCGAYAPDQAPPETTPIGYITSSPPYQNFLLYLQPANGGQGKAVMEFYDDSGKPYGGPINFSRQNGNPPRVAGDTRPGAINYLVAAETSIGQIALFNSDDRWTKNLIYQNDNRYVTVQPFSLDTSALVPTPLSKAFDAIYGTYEDPYTPPIGGNQVSRTGGSIAALDNGNFVVVIHDRTGFLSGGSDATTASIVTPTGAIVKERWLVDPRDIWDNVAAYKGGFCIRVHETLYFYDNNGNLMGSVDQSASEESYDTGRGDGTRIGAHVNSPYVYLIGKVKTANVVKVSVFDSTTQSFVAKADVSEGSFTGDFDRASIAVDALNRFAAVWVSKPAGYKEQQVAARVMAFDPATKTIKPLTLSFFPFINHAENAIRTVQMTVAMTTRQIMVAAKGEINLKNNPSDGPDSPKEINFFTVFTHPAPADDPTPPVGGVPIHLAQPTVSGNNLVLTWTGGTGPFTVQRKTTLNDPTWQTVTTTSNRQATVAISGASGFFRIVQ